MHCETAFPISYYIQICLIKKRLPSLLPELSDYHEMSAIEGQRREIIRSRFSPLSALMALSAEPLNLAVDFGVTQR